jgi:hypothetical protein
LSERRPDELSANARRWVTGAGINSDARVIDVVLHALERDYDDVIVVRGIVRWRLARGLRSGEVVTLSA